jgi:hypothetical protein
MSRSPSGSRFGAIRLLAVLSALVTLAAFTIPLMSSSASAETANPPVTVTATVNSGSTVFALGSTIPGLHDGDVVHVSVNAGSPPNATASSIFGIEGRECANVPINNSFDFTPTQGGNCANVALGTGSLHPQVAIAPPNLTGTMDFTVGAGSTTFTDEDAVSHTVTCQSGTTCKLALALAVPGASDYESFLLSFAGPPSDPAVTAVPGESSATLNWTAPTDNGGSAIAHYLVTETAPVAGAPQTVAGLTDHITGLTDFTAYTFEVQAVNTDGFTSPGTAANASVTVTPGPTPAVITNATAGNAQATLTWTAASGSPTGYSVTSTPTVAPPAACTNITALTCVFTGLTNGTAYTFVVTATYAGGTSPSLPSASVTPLANFGSVTQTFSVTRAPGALVIGEACSGNTDGPFPDKPYLGSPTPENCNIDLGTAVFQPGGFYQATGNVSDVEVRDQRDSDVGWHVNASLTPFTSAGGSFPACNFGYAPAASGEGALAPYVQSAAPGPAVGAGCPGGYSAPQTVATAAAGGGLGDSLINGAVTVEIPVSAPSGTYTAVLTFTLLTN